MVTGAWIEGPGIDPPHLREALARPFDVRDSKKVFSQKDLGKGEIAALAVVHALTGETPTTATHLADILSAPSGRPALPCSTSTNPCSLEGLSLPLWAQPTEITTRASQLREALQSLGVIHSGIESALVCPWELNTRLDSSLSKLDLDLELFLEVAARIRARWTEPGLVTCGKIGNRKSYAHKLEAPTTILESRTESCYDVPSLGRIRFLLDADDSDPLVSMASLVGKYLRELTMEAIHSHASRLVPDLRRPSGYRDPVTTGFLERTRDPLLASGVRPDCLERCR